MTLPLLPGWMPVRANWGRWISDCSGRYCLNAWELERGQTAWSCHLCGTTTSVEWPANPGAIEYLLMMRPFEANRNWAPPETVADLVAENIAHGIMPPQVAALDPAATVDLITVVDGRLASGILLPELMELER